MSEFATAENVIMFETLFYWTRSHDLMPRHKWSFKRLIQDQNPSERWVLIDHSQRSPKAVPLHNENSKPSIRIAHSVHLKESYDEMKKLLEAIQWNVQ
jgi:hypothetical protein